SIADNNAVTRITQTYNTYGQPLVTTVPAAISASGTNEQVTLAYHPITGDLISITNSLGDQITIDNYDALGDPLSVSLYPDTGNPSPSTHPLTTSAIYDAAQHPIQINTPDGNQLLTTFTNGVITRFQTYNPTLNGGTVLAQMNLSTDTRGRLYAASDLVGSL